jgi:hypothetical protein
MSLIQPTPETIPRAEAINLLRTELLTRVDPDNSACKMAAENGIFCRGFARFDDAEMKRRFLWISRRRPDMSRQELDEIANRWQLARQDVNQLPIACDVQQHEHDSCGGWDDFSNEDLSRHYFEMTGNDLVVV